jgi:hypothetical protein
MQSLSWTSHRMLVPNFRAVDWMAKVHIETDLCNASQGSFLGGNLERTLSCTSRRTPARLPKYKRAWPQLKIHLRIFSNRSARVLLRAWELSLKSRKNSIWEAGEMEFQALVVTLVGELCIRVVDRFPHKLVSWAVIRLGRRTR